MPGKHTVLITGSSGMLGIDLCQELTGDYEVYGIDNHGRAGLNLPYNSMLAAERYFECDITNRKNIEEAFKKITPEIVIHAAAMTDVDGCELNRDKAYGINAAGTENVALACKKAGSSLVYISTDFVFDGSKKESYIETDKTGPLSVYGSSKLKGEEAVARSLKNYFVIRTSWLYGRHGKNFVEAILAKAEAGKVLKVVDDQVGSPTYTKDLAGAIRVLIEKVQGSRVEGQVYGIYHVSNSGSVSWYEYAKEIVRLEGSGASVVPISSTELARPAKRPAMSVLDNSRFEGLTGYHMRPWKDALKEYMLERKER